MITERTTLPLLTTALLLTAALTPLPTRAASLERTYRIQTRIVEQAPSVGEYDGSLQLHVSHDGILSGYYRPQENPRFVSVTGGVTGNRLWIEIGSLSRRPWRFSGTFENGTIAASSNGVIVDDGRYTGLNLIGTPSAK